MATTTLSNLDQIANLKSLAIGKNIRIMPMYSGFKRTDDNIIGIRCIAPSTLRCSNSTEFVEQFISENELDWTITPDTGVSFTVRFKSHSDESKQVLSNQFKQIASTYETMIAFCETMIKNDPADAMYWELKKATCINNRQKAINDAN